MAKQTFTTGQTLTAAQMTSLQANDYNWTVSAQTASYVLTATNAGQHITMNSASSTTITVNTSLFTAGDTARLTNIGAGVCTITAGTATVTSAGSLALAQWASGILYFTSASAAIFFPDMVSGGSSGLVLVKSQVIGSAVSTVSVTSAFSGTYDAYVINVAGGVTSATANLAMTLGAAATGYYSGGNVVTYSSATNTPVSNNNAASWTRAGVGTTSSIGFNVFLQDPFLSKTTKMQSLYAGTATTSDGGIIAGFLNDTTSYTSFAITPASGTMTGGTIRVYGYAN